MLQTDNLTFRYKKEGQIFKFPNIALDENENLLILGKSGIGKTTFLHLLAGLLSPTDGKVVIDDVSINLLFQSKLDTFRGQKIGLVFQKNYAVKSLSVLENLYARLFFSKKTIDNDEIDKLLEQLGIKDSKNSKIHELSEGQLQRLGIALSVIHKPKIILADEPTSSLDDENCKVVIELLKNQAERTHANLIVITHDQRIKTFFQNSITL